MPRPEPTRHDATAQAFLRAGAQLLDVLLTGDAEDKPSRLKSFPYPPPLDWIRVEDVVRLAESTSEEKPSRNAFRNRWAAKDDFVRDLLAYTLLWRDLPSGPTEGADAARETLLDHSIPLSVRIRVATENAAQTLTASPRSLLLMHLVPVLSPDSTDFLGPSFEVGLAEEHRWREAYDDLSAAMGVAWRPGWTSERFVIVVQALLDGLLLRYRLQPEGLGGGRWEIASTFAEAVIAMVSGVGDFERSGGTTGDHLDALVAEATREALTGASNPTSGTGDPDPA